MKDNNLKEYDLIWNNCVLSVKDGSSGRTQVDPRAWEELIKTQLGRVYKVNADISVDIMASIDKKIYEVKQIEENIREVIGHNIRERMVIHRAEVGKHHPLSIFFSWYSQTSDKKSGDTFGSVSQQELAPPRTAEKLAYFVLPKAMRDAMLGDLEEEYHELCLKFGERFARAWYWKQIITSTWPILCRAFTKLAAFAWLGKAAHWLINKLGT